MCYDSTAQFWSIQKICLVGHIYPSPTYQPLSDNLGCLACIMKCTSSSTDLRHSPPPKLDISPTHCEVVSQKLHDKGAIFIGVLLQSVQLGNGIIECLQSSNTLFPYRAHHGNQLTAVNHRTLHREFPRGRGAS